MKNYLILVCITLCISISYSQSFYSEYNGLYERYEIKNSDGKLIGYNKWNNLEERFDCYDNNNNLIGYQKWDNLYERWEYTSLNNEKSYTSSKNFSGIHDYGEPQSTFDATLAIKALAYKQAKYDMLSYENKEKLNEIRSYQNSREWVNNATYKYLKRFKKYDDKQDKEWKKNTKRNRRKTRGVNRLKIENLKSGWYEAYSVVNNYMVKRKILIENGRITKYINGMNLIGNVIQVNEISKNYEIDVQFGDINLSSKIFIIDNKNIKDDPKYFEPVKVIFYTDASNVRGEIFISLYKDKKHYRAGILKNYWASDSPSCVSEKYVTYTFLPPGKYEYIAFSDDSFWKSDVILEQDSSCKIINLTK